MKTELVSKCVGYVYAIETDSNHVKIGCSINPLQRIRTIETQSGKASINYWVSYELENWYLIESMVHELLKAKRKIGEYFDVSFNDAITTINSVLPQKLTTNDYHRLEKKQRDGANKSEAFACQMAQGMTGFITRNKDIEYNKNNCKGCCNLCVDHAECDKEYEETNMLYQCILNSNDDDIAAQMEWGSKLSNEQVILLAIVRRRNESYLMAGIGYEERKKKLIAFAMKHRTKLIE